MKLPWISRKKHEQALRDQAWELRWRDTRRMLQGDFPAGYCLINEEAVKDWQKNGNFTRPVDLVWSKRGGSHKDMNLGPPLEWNIPGWTDEELNE